MAILNNFLYCTRTNYVQIIFVVMLISARNKLCFYSDLEEINVMDIIVIYAKEHFSTSSPVCDLKLI